MKNKTFFNALFLAFAFAFFANAVQAQTEQSLYKVNSGAFPGPNGVVKITPDDGFYIAIYSDKADKNNFQIAIISDLGTGGYTRWRTRGRFIGGYMTDVTRVNRGFYDNEFDATWYSYSNVKGVEPRVVKIGYAYPKGSKEVMILLYSPDGEIITYYFGQAIFDGYLEP